MYRSYTVCLGKLPHGFGTTTPIQTATSTSKTDLFDPVESRDDGDRTERPQGVSDAQGAVQGVLLDYIILQSDGTYQRELTHKEAVLKAFDLLMQPVHPEQMNAEPCPVSEFFALPEDVYYQTKPPLTNRAFEIPAPLSYWFTFLEPPYSNPYTIVDFEKLNCVLFPFPDNLEVYRC